MVGSSGRRLKMKEGLHKRLWVDSGVRYDWRGKRLESILKDRHGES